MIKSNILLECFWLKNKYDEKKTTRLLFLHSGAESNMVPSELKRSKQNGAQT